MQLYLRLFHNILPQQKKIKWKLEHQQLFQEMKFLLTDQNSITIPDSYQTIYAMCDASKLGIGAALLQSNKGTNEMKLISANLKFFTQEEPRLSTFMR